MKDGKSWYHSKTVWGGLILAAEAAVLAYPLGWEQAALAGLGVFITIFGFRDALY